MKVGALINCPRRSAAGPRVEIMDGPFGPASETPSLFRSNIDLYQRISWESVYSICVRIIAYELEGEIKEIKVIFASAHRVPIYSLEYVWDIWIGEYGRNGLV